MGLSIYLTTSLILLVLGFFCILSKKNLVKIAMGMSIMVKACSLLFLMSKGSIAEVFVVQVIIIDAIVTAILMSLSVNIYKQAGTLDVDLVTSQWRKKPNA